MQATDWPNVESDMTAWRDWAGAGLPDGVHRLSAESQAVLARVAEKSAAAIARHTKRGS